MSNTKIKPILHRNLSIQNLYQYNDFFRRRPKQTLNFKFQCPERKSHYGAQTNQNRLFSITKQLKVLKKVDLSQAEIRHNHVNQNKALSIYKRFSKVFIISILTYCNLSRLNHDNPLEKWPRLLPKVREITYQMIRSPFEAGKQVNGNHFQRNIKFCPKLDSLVIEVDQMRYFLSSTFHEFERYPQRLKRLVIKPETSFREFNSSSSLKHLKNLESVSLTISPRFYPQLIKETILVLPTLPHIREISLDVKDGEKFNIYPLAFDKIASQAVTLRKLKLKFAQKDCIPQNIIKSLQNFHQLTSFTLSLNCEGLLPFISECIKNMNQLQYLKLTLAHANINLKSMEGIRAICTEISKLKQLQHLKLSFDLPALCHNAKINEPNFLLHLKDACNRKLKTFSLTCNQINSSNRYLDLFKMLENSKTSLQKLRIGLGYYYPDKDHEKAISTFLNGLLKIRILEFPQLDISEKKFLGDISKAAQKMKYLEVLRVRMIQETVTKPGFFRGVVSILKKRGLRRFDYEVEEFFMETLKAKSANARKIILGQLRRMNPSLELIPHKSELFDHSIFEEEEENWWEEEIIEEFVCACGYGAH